MANWTLAWPGGPPYGGPLPSATMGLIDAFLTKVPNAAEGSAHTAQSVVQIGGAGCWFPGAMRADFAQIVVPLVSSWAPSTNYSSPALVAHAGNLYLCIVGGTSSSVGPSGIGTNIADGSVVWNYVALWSPIGLQINGQAQVGSTGVFALQAGAQGFIRAGASLTVQGAPGNAGEIVVGNNGLIDVTTGANLNVESLAAINLNGFLAAINVNSSALISVNSGGGIAWASGAAGIFNAGSSLLIYSAATVESGGELGINAGALLSIAGTTLFGSGSFCSYLSGSTVQVFQGATFTTWQPIPGTSPGQNNFTITSVSKAWAGRVTTGSSPSIGDDLNVAHSITYSAAPGGAAAAIVNVSFVQPFANANYALTITPFAPPGGASTLQCVVPEIVSQTAAGFSFLVYIIDLTYSVPVSFWNHSTSPFTFSFNATGRQ